MNTRVTNQYHTLKPQMAATDVFQQVSVSNATAQTLATLGVTILDTAKVLHLSADGDIRFTEQTVNGTAVAPTALIGHLLRGLSDGIYMDADRARAIKLISAGSGAVTLNITKLTD